MAVLAWNSILLLPMLLKEFRAYFRRPLFIVFFGVWMCLQGATVVVMVRWTPVVFWPVLLLIELAAGFVAAKWLCDFPLDQEQQQG